MGKFFYHNLRMKYQDKARSASAAMVVVDMNEPEDQRISDALGELVGNCPDAARLQSIFDDGYKPPNQRNAKA
eukprot:13854008-Alexandrium_andersonii.AAC.1